MPKTETINGRTIFRSGESFAIRQCPKHSVDLELCIDDTDYSEWLPEQRLLYDHHDNRVCWRCDACLGFWLENHFIDELDSKRPYKIQTMQLVLPCPSCGSRRVQHGCFPGCCEQHYCVDCGGNFEARIRVVREGQKPDVNTVFPRFRGQSSLASGPSTGMTRTGIVRSYRSGPGFCDQPLELVIGGPERRVEEQVGWYCEDNGRVHYEAGGLRRRRPGFTAEIEAGAACPVCGSTDVDNSESAESKDCVCRSCGSELEVVLLPT